MGIRAKRVRSKRDLARAVDLAARVFSNYFDALEQWHDLLRFDPGYAPGQTFVVEREGEFVSHVRVTLRTVRLGSAVAQLGGIGDVATHPAHRNHGYASACLEQAARFMREAGCFLSALDTGRFSFYQRLGWELAVPAYRIQLNTVSLPSEILNAYSRRRFRPDEDLPAVMNLYNAYNAGRLLSVVRSADYWRRQMEFSMRPPVGGPWRFAKEDAEGFLVVSDRSKSIIAYARSRDVQGRVEVVEVAARDRPAALALLAHLAEHYRRHPHIVLHEPPDSLVADVALTTGGAQCAVSRGDVMVRILDLPQLFELLAPTLAARVCRSELATASGALRLCTEDESVTLQWRKGEVSLSRARKGQRLEIPCRQLAQLVTGYRSPTSVLEELGRLGDVNTLTVRALEVLFPRSFAHIHTLDRF